MKIGLIQICSVLDAETNLAKLDFLLLEAVREQVKYVFLPECFYSMSDGSRPTPFLVAKDNEHLKKIQMLAKKHNVFLLGGSVAYDNDGQVINRNLNIDDQGKLLGHYDKKHLFNCNLGNKVIDEGNIYKEGKEDLLLEVDELKIGMGICFDLRFSNMWMHYRKQGANLMSISSAFTVPTGRAHWHILARARAIETQCFVVASAQVGKNNEKISTYGHSLIINPWGEVLVDAKEEEGFFSVEIDLSEVKSTRAKVGIDRYL